MRKSQNAVFPGQGLDLRENVSLRREKQSHSSPARLEVADIRGQHCIQVALAVGALERERRAEICVDDGYRSTQSRVFGREYTEARGQRHSKVLAEPRAGGLVHCD